MAYTIKNFRLNIIVRVILIGLVALLLTYVLLNTEWLFTPLFLALLLIILTINLISYSEKINRELAQFLYNIKQGGFTSLTKTGSGHLGEVFNEVIEEFKKVNIEKESHYQYLKTLNENIGISIISYKQDGSITFVNPAGKALLQKPYLKNISDLQQVDGNLFRTVTTMRSGQREVVKVFIEGNMVQVTVQLKKFILQQETFYVILMQNIHSELEQKEVEAWQKLISVLTHEIMNSVTPIASLSTAINQQLIDVQQWDKLEQSDKQDLLISLQTIENRSNGLLKFVNAYKEFAKTPELRLSESDLVAIIQRICNLLDPDLRKAGIRLNLHFKMKELVIRLDHELIEQVFINILKNAIEALHDKKDPAITIELNRIEGRRAQVKIMDNGPGMEKDVLERIFIPFFTTKKKGTGIGLSFTRQVMKLHGGNIIVKSEAGTGTEIALEF